MIVFADRTAVAFDIGVVTRGSKDRDPTFRVAARSQPRPMFDGQVVLTIQILGDDPIHDVPFAKGSFPF